MRARSIVALLSLCVPAIALEGVWDIRQSHVAGEPGPAEVMKPFGPLTSDAPSDSYSDVLPIAVDGAETPELIPDHIAHFHFVLAAAAASDASPEQIARRDRAVGPVGLSALDRGSLVRALANVREQLDEIAAARSSLAASDVNVQLDATILEEREKSTLSEARTALYEALSQDGRVRLDTYVQKQLKRTIVIYGDMPH